MGARIILSTFTLIAAASLALGTPARAQPTNPPAQSESPAERGGVAPKIVPDSTVDQPGVVHPPNIDAGIDKPVPDVDPGITKPPAAKPAAPQPQSPPAIQPR